MAAAKRDAKGASKELNGQLAEMDEALAVSLKRAERENSTVYLMRVPNVADLPPIQPHSLAKCALAQQLCALLALKPALRSKPSKIGFLTGSWLTSLSAVVCVCTPICALLLAAAHMLTQSPAPNGGRVLHP